MGKKEDFRYQIIMPEKRNGWRLCQKRKSTTLGYKSRRSPSRRGEEGLFVAVLRKGGRRRKDWRSRLHTNLPEKTKKLERRTKQTIRPFTARRRVQKKETSENRKNRFL